MSNQNQTLKVIASIKNDTSYLVNKLDYGMFDFQQQNQITSTYKTLADAVSTLPLDNETTHLDHLTDNI